MAAVEKRPERIPDARRVRMQRVDRVVEIAPDHQPRDRAADGDHASERYKQLDDAMFLDEALRFRLQRVLPREQLGRVQKRPSCTAAWGAASTGSGSGSGKSERPISSGSRRKSDASTSSIFGV